MSPVRTPLARVNPVTRLLSALLVTFPLLITLDWVSAVIAIGCELIVWSLLDPHHLGSRLCRLVKRMIPLFIAAPLAGGTMILYGNPGGRTLWAWGFILVSDQSINYGIAVAARVLVLGLTAVAALTDVDPTDMADGLAQVAHLPHRFVLGSLAGVRLITELTWDWKSMEWARRARGLGDSGLLKRLTTPFALLVTAIRRGSTLATAMEARGFGSGKRTWARPSTVGWPDLVCVVTCLGIVAASLGFSLATGNFRWIGAL